MPVLKTKNEKFFKTWSPEMAYVLGLFAADGNMIRNKRGAHFIEFQITDKDLLVKVRVLLGSNHKITNRKRSEKWKISYRLQIGSKEIFNDLLKYGMTPNKSKIILFPAVPDEYLAHFIRGYFDGDGNIIFGSFKRKNRPGLLKVILARFTSGSKEFLNGLAVRVKKKLSISGSLFFQGRAWRLNYSNRPSIKLLDYIYGGNLENLPILERKHNEFLKAKEVFNVGR